MDNNTAVTVNNLDTVPERVVLDLLKFEPEYDIPDSVDSVSGRKKASDIINRTSANIAYYNSLETMSRIRKREARRDKKTEEYNRYAEFEDIFKTLKDNEKTVLDNVTKLMTLNRLKLDEAKMFKD